jgi:hypothetical protein
VVGNKIGTEFTVKDGTSLVDSPEAALLTDGGRIAYAIGDFSSGDADVMTSVWRARDVSHDFDGDGKSGVLWRNNGQVQFWEMDGLGVKTEGGVAHAPVTSDGRFRAPATSTATATTTFSGAMTVARSISGR